MPEGALLKAIEEDAYVQSARIIQEAEEAARELTELAGKEAASLREERLKAQSDSFERKRASAINGARTRMNGLRLKLRQEFIEGIFKGVTGKFKSLPKKEHDQLIKRLYEELKRDWLRDKGDQRPVVHISPSDLSAVKDDWALFSPDGGVSLGVVFTSKDGRIRYGNTIESRLRRAERTLTAAVDKILFG
ncbi:MAG: hypothetical protein HY954_06310 [Deltaproteobacteria bacterium]|nr:hypothetical protein [Deltaproteobacteria bacterium]